MSDNEEKPRSNKVFYWLGAIIILGLLFLGGQYLYWKYRASSATNTGSSIVSHPSATQLSSAISSYTEWVNALPDNKMNVDHELTRTGLYKMAGVLEFMPDSSDAASQKHTDISTIRNMADSITYNWKSGRHADMIKKAFLNAEDLISTLYAGKSNAIDEQIAELKLKINEIDKQTLTLNQRDAVKDAFVQVGTLFKEIDATAKH